MFRHKHLHLTLAALATAGTALGQDGHEVETRKVGASHGRPAADLFELNLVESPRGARLELRGGRPGNLAALAIAEGPAPLAGEGPVLLPRTTPVTVGRFDAEGAFTLPVDPADHTGSSFSVQGVHFGPAAEGRPVRQFSHVLEVTVTAASAAPAPTATEPEADFSLLRIDLDPNRRDEVVGDVTDGDLMGALDAALNSAGDSLVVGLNGKLMVKVYGIDMGGSVGFTARVARAENGYTVAIGQELALLVGLKATDTIGVEGGVSLGADEIYRFASPGEVARGLRGIAIQQALGTKAELLNQQNMARLRAARSAFRRAHAWLQQLRSRASFLRNPLAERAAARVRAARARVLARARQAADASMRVLTWTTTELQFVRDHTDGVEMRLSIPRKAEFKIGSQKLKFVEFELGAKAEQSNDIVLRTWQAWRQPARKVTIRSGLDMTVGASAAAKAEFARSDAGKGGSFGRGIEVEVSTEIASVITFERDGDGEFGAPALAMRLTRGLKVCSFVRETSLSVPVAGGKGLEAAAALLRGEPAEGLGTLASVPITTEVQDKWHRAMKPEFGWTKGLTAKVGASLSWTDAGPARSCERTLPEIIERLRDVERTRREVRELVGQIVHLRAEMQ